MTRVALIGLGMVADTHLAAIKQSSALSLAGVLGRDKSKSETYAKEMQSGFGAPVRPYADISEIAKDPTVDFAVIATPPDARADFVRVLAGAGKPILVEKPIERTLQAARQIVDFCEAEKVPLGVVFQHRARDASAALKQVLSEGELGRIVAADIRVPWWREQSYYDAPGRGTYRRDGGGVLITQAIHTLDLALWLLGPFLRVQALLRTTDLHNMEAEDWAGALFETQAGCVGTLSATTAAFPGGSESIRLSGTKGGAVLESGVLTIELQDGQKRTFGETASTGGGADPMGFSHAWHQTVLENFADSLKRNRPLLASGHDGLMSHALVDALENSSRTKAWTEVPN